MTYRLPLIAPKPTATFKPETTRPRCTFKTAQQRKVEQRAAALAKIQKEKAKVKMYQRKDIAVGDVVRVVGKVDEWARKKPTGLEWVRGVTVEESGGGSIGKSKTDMPLRCPEVVHPDEQFWHLQRVQELHETVYCRPFSIPPVPTISAIHPSPNESMFFDSMSLQSEMPSELTISQGGLPDIRKLRSSQLHEVTFRRYVLDYMTEEVRSAVLSADIKGSETVDRALHQQFPEYPISRKGKERAILAPSTRSNCTDPNLTPRTFRSKAPVEPDIHFPSFDVGTLLEVPVLAELASMVVEAETKKEERRRRRRIRDGEAKERDLAIQQEKKGQWRLSSSETRKAMERLCSSAIRVIGIEGNSVHVSPTLTNADNNLTPRKSHFTSEAYTPLPPPLILPLLLYHLKAEKEDRSKVFISRSDPRKGNGMTLEELVNRMRRWGQEGRWERLGEWRVEEGLQWGLVKGVVRREGVGYWAVEREEVVWA